jgi:hypothetical protein
MPHVFTVVFVQLCGFLKHFLFRIPPSQISKITKPVEASLGVSNDWGAIHQLLSIILKLRILVLLTVSTMPYVVIVTNYS